MYLKKGSIVKLQIPLATNEEPLALVYNEDRSYEVYLPITIGLKIMMGVKNKKYFYAHYDKKLNNTVIEKEAPEQIW